MHRKVTKHILWEVNIDIENEFIKDSYCIKNYQPLLSYVVKNKHVKRHSVIINSINN